MSRQRQVVFFLVILASLGAASPRAVIGQAELILIGRIRMQGGDVPAGSIPVELMNRGRAIARVFADSDGKFIFRQLAANSYYVVVDVEGYERAEEFAVVRSDGMPPPPVRIVLRKKKEHAAGSPGGPASGGNPNAVSLRTLTLQIPEGAKKEFEKGVEAAQGGKTDQAIANYEAAIEIAPEFYAAYNNLGSQYLRQGRLELAELQFDKARELNDADGNALLNLGNVYVLTGRFEMAREVLQEGRQLDGQSVFGNFLMGLALFNLSDGTGAEQSFKRVLALDSGHAEARMALVNLYLQQQRDDEALRELKVFVEKYPGHPQHAQARAMQAKLEAWIESQLIPD